MRLSAKSRIAALLLCSFLVCLSAIGSPLKNAQPAPQRPDAVNQALKEAYRNLSQGQLDLAEAAYQSVLARRAHEKDALLGLAVIYQRRQQEDRAASLYLQVLDEDMGNAAAAAGLISLSIPADPVAAESQLKELLDLKPASPELHYALGSALAYQERLNEARQAFQIAYSLAPGNALYAYNLAVSLDRLHQPEAALRYYEKSLRLSQSDQTLFDREAVKKRIRQLAGHALQEMKP